MLASKKGKIMGIVIDNCIEMECGRFLCWEEKGCYVVDLRKKKATAGNVPPKEWIKLANMLGEKGKNIERLHNVVKIVKECVKDKE